MTRMAAFEQHEGKENNAINSYFRSDYVGFEVLKSIISATIVYLILVAAYVMYHFSDVLQDIYNTDIMGTARKYLVYYIALVAVYSVISGVYYSIRYRKMRSSMRAYYACLKKLGKMYEKE
ncbi:hypothetical protein [Ruminococcus sp.]|uniref:hypothetical protein n=1 Tax=Ruminococcus sp. TaxID=41978 RepID=UPI002587E2A6|nr:hypothetical protein [Ruminococcus sp.]